MVINEKKKGRKSNKRTLTLTCSRVGAHWKLTKHGIPSASLGSEQQRIALWLILAGVQQVYHQLKRLGIGNKIVFLELVPLEGVGMQHLLQT